MRALPRQQRVAAYAVVLRDDRILLCRLSPRISREELWTLPGGGVDHGEHPRDAVVREIQEETGLDAEVGDTARVYSAHLPGVRRDGRRVDAHALRIVYDGWVPPDAPEPQVVEVDGSTAEAAWIRLRDVLDGTVSVAALVLQALADHRPFQRQRVAAYAVVRRGETVLLTRLSARAHHPGLWTLPGGGIDHGEPPAVALAREVAEECGVACRVGDLLDVHDLHFAGTAPSGRHEDFHGIHLLFAATVPPDAQPRVAEVGGTTDAVAWVALAEVASGAVPVTDVVRAALG
ncbi:MAG TPA: NUDIX domain-containing protein [Nocardioides sp.]|uniref:NUDIX domain-containing protein n=1 Tax=Nocardioides sp. TaxID=35761 RepID=UPI002BB26738|nr:NUDIX domain-containing protein [Nocardioides sp.]HQR28150.1 NUDIX domain-containing protein [Nocardioides sp.]